MRRKKRSLSFSLSLSLRNNDLLDHWIILTIYFKLSLYPLHSLERRRWRMGFSFRREHGQWRIGYCVSGELILWEDYQRFEPTTIGETRQFRSGRCSSSYEANYFGSGRKHGRVFRNKSMDPLGDRYKCSKCSKSYRWKHHLMEHVKASCGQKKAECCPYCSYRSNRKWNLKSHMKRIHADV